MPNAVSAAQIFLEQQIDPAWRTRAQALLTLLNGGIGNLIGYLGGGWWLNACTTTGHTDWRLFWETMSAIVAAMLGYFLIAFREQGLRRGKFDAAIKTI